MKCKYTQCKLGGEVEKDVAVKDGSAYYHKECYDKKKFKQDIQEYFNNKRKYFVKRDWNIALSRMIDGQGLDIEFVDFVAKKKFESIDQPYKIMYYCKFDDLKNEYNEILKNKLKKKQSEEIKNVKIEDTDYSFVFKKEQQKPNKKYCIY